MQKIGNSVQKRGKRGHSAWLINKGTHRANQIRAVDRPNNNETKWRPLWEGLERTKTLIHVKFDRYKENNKDINQSTITWTFGQHK